LVIYRKYLNCSSELSFVLRVHVEMAGNVWEEWQYCSMLMRELVDMLWSKKVKQSAYRSGEAPRVPGI